MESDTIQGERDAQELALLNAPNARRSALTGKECATSHSTENQPTTESTRVVHVNDQIPDCVYIGRGMPARGIADSIWGNAYKIGRDGNRAQCIQGFSADLYKFKYTKSDIMHHLPDLRGKPLACWCRHDGESITPANKCHGDILVEALERYTDDELRSFGIPRTRNPNRTGGRS